MNLTKIFEKKPAAARLDGFFSLITVLNQRSRPDRLKDFEQEASRVGITDYVTVNAVEDPNSYASFNRSVLFILETFVNTGFDRLLFLEDDVVFSDGVQEKFMQAARELPEEWDMIYLGCNIIGQNVKPYSEHLAITTGAWTTHAVGMTREIARVIVDSKPNPEEGMMDDWFARNIHPSRRSFVCRPMLAVQRPGFSDLWGRPTDYSGIFKEANKKICGPGF